MQDATTEFFAALGSRGHAPLLEKVSSTFRFDLTSGKKTERWLLAVSKGDLTVSRQNRAADCVMRLDKALFGRLVSGEQNAMAAVLRGEVALEGDWTLLVQFQRLLPGPSAARTSRGTAGHGRKRS